MQFFEINICQGLIFKIHINYQKNEKIKTGNQTIEKSQVLLQVLE